MKEKIDEVGTNKLIANIKDSAGHMINIDLTPLQSFGPELSKKIVECLCKFCSPYNSITTAKVLRTLLKQFGNFYIQNTANLNDKKKIYSLLFNFRNHWYTTKSIAQRLDSRNSSWDVFIRFMKYLMADNVIPTVTIPPGNPKFHNKDILAKTALSNNEKADECITSLIPISLARSDEEYLDELEAQFTEARDVFLACAKKEIDKMEADMLAGQEMILSVDYEELKRLTNQTTKTTKPYFIMPRSNADLVPGCEQGKVNQKVSLYGSKYVDGYKNILARIHYEYAGYYRKYKDGRQRKEDRVLSNLPFSIPSAKTMCAHLGLLTSRGAVPFFVYLLLKNPKFTVEALAKVEVEGENGIMKYITTAGEDSNKVRMKLKKGRAKVEKSEILDEETTAVVELLLCMTQPYRNYLKKINDPNYKYLWLCGGTVGSDHPYLLKIEGIRKQFGQKAYRINEESNKSEIKQAKRSFLAVHPEIEKYIRTANLSRLRVTAGLIVWFKSGGDAKAVARAFGNTVKVSVDHYIPRPLQVLMNKRLIRRFQNLLIVAATAGEAFMLQATDFLTIEELHAFLLQMLGDGRSSGNELLSELQLRLERSASKAIKPCDVQSNQNKGIAIKVTETNLALLFLYEEHVKSASTSTKNLNHHDELTSTTPAFWSELSCLLRSALQNEPSLKSLNTIYTNALIKTEVLRPLLKFPVIAAE